MNSKIKQLKELENIIISAAEATGERAYPLPVWEEVVEDTKGHIADLINDEIILVVSSDKLLFSLNLLKRHIGYHYQLLTCISGVDFLDKNYRFSVVYDLLSLTYNSRLRLKVFVNEITSVPSSVDVFINANWWEREIWDLYGIYF